MTERRWREIYLYHTQRVCGEGSSKWTNDLEFSYIQARKGDIDSGFFIAKLNRLV